MRPPAAAAAAAAAETPPAFRPAPLHPSPSRDLAALAPARRAGRARRATPIESEGERAREGVGEDAPLLAPLLLEPGCRPTTPPPYSCPYGLPYCSLTPPRHCRRLTRAAPQAARTALCAALGAPRASSGVST